MSALPSTPTLPSEPATPPIEDAERVALKHEIDSLLPQLYRGDSSRELSGLLKVVSRARYMGREGQELLKTLAQRLRQMRAFDDLYILTSRMNATGMGDKQTQRLEIQALIELKVHETALELVRPLLGDGVKDPDAREAYGHLGRIYKQMYVDAVKSAASGGEQDERATLQLYLDRAFGAYMHVWHNYKSPETAWHGINAVAIAQLAERDGFTQKDPQAEQLAREVLAVVSAPGIAEPWARGTMGQAYIALGDFENASAAYNVYAGQSTIEPFALAASLRQLEEVWGLSGEDPVRGGPVRLLKAALIAKLSETVKTEQGLDSPPPLADRLSIDVQLTSRESRLIRDEVIGDGGIAGSARQALQKTFSDNFPFGVKQLRKGMQRADAVCRIHGMRGGVMEAFASGFAIKGSLLNEAWGDKPVIVTNNHVISSRPSAESRRFDLCEAVFISPDDDTEQTVRFERIVWESQIDAHDVTILAIKDDLPASVTPLSELLPTALGPRASDDSGIGRCFVIGFPGAGELSFSFADNLLLDHDCPDGCEIREQDGRRVCTGVRSDPVRIHYKTPTVGGSSGSPVFDGDHFALLAVHHSGAPNLERLNKRGGSYAANEGIWIDSIRQAIAETLAAASAEGWTGPNQRWRGFADEPPAAAPPIAVSSAEIVAKAIPAAALAAAATAGEISGSPGDRLPGVSGVARQVLYKPGIAEDVDIRAARLESVIGHDNRTRIFDTGMSPWRMICAIRARWGSRLMVGTGCFIGPNTILTAGHVVFPREFASLPDSVEVIPGLNADDQPYSTFLAPRLSVHPRWQGAFEIHNDVAVIHLDQPIGSRVGWFGLAARTREQLVGQWAHVTGYPGEKKEEADPRGQPATPPPQAAQLWHHAAPIVKVEANRIFYKADTTAGQSGAPIYVLREAGNYATPVVIGVHAYGARSAPGAIGPANSGAWITEDMLKIIAMWRSA